MSGYTGRAAAPPALAAPARRRSALLRREHLVILGAGFFGYAVLAWLAAYVVETYNNDGLARMAQAHAVFFSREPHLAAVGFVWPPIPVLSDLPLVLVLKPLGLTLLAGGLMSAAYGAFALTQAAVALEHFGLPRGWRIVWVVAFAAHPLLVQNAAMGLSEPAFMAFLLLSLNGFLRWERDRKPGGLIWAGVGAAGATYCRYEALAWVAVLALAVAWQIWLDPRGPAGSTVAGSVIALVTPPLWVLFLWVVLNWQIMSNPLYFLTGPGSTATTPDTASKVGSSHLYFDAYNSPLGSLRLIAAQVFDLAPLLGPATALLLLAALGRRRWGDLVYVPVAWSIVGFTYLIAVRGLLPPFSRYFFWIVPAGLIVAGAAYRATPVGWPQRVVAGSVGALLVATSLGFAARAWPRVPEPLPLRPVAAVLLQREAQDMRDVRGQLAKYREMAAYLNGQPRGTTTLVDASVGEALVFFLARPQELVLTVDSDFFAVLRAPQGRVDQVLVPYPTFDARGRSFVLGYYPKLYEGGEPWAELLREFSGKEPWRLYRVRPPGAGR